MLTKRQLGALFVFLAVSSIILILVTIPLYDSYPVDEAVRPSGRETLHIATSPTTDGQYLQFMLRNITQLHTKMNDMQSQISDVLLRMQFNIEYQTSSLNESDNRPTSMTKSSETQPPSDVASGQPQVLNRDLLVLAIGTGKLQHYGKPDQGSHIAWSQQIESYYRDWYFSTRGRNASIKTEDLYKSCPGEAGRCSFTTDPAKYTEADVVLISTGGVFDDPDHLNGQKLIRGHERQKFAFHFFEQPFNFKLNDMQHINERIGFNMTVHYQTDATVWWPYGWTKWRTQPLNLPEMNYASGRARKVMFVTSRCSTLFQHRETYVSELIKYIDVDVFGKCIDNSQSKDPISVYQMARNYKFLIAIENGDCDDYITEKFFRYTQQINIIPIVLGRRNNYETLAPPSSYIQASQFDSPEQLAAYLHVLDKDDSLYNQYFAWKSNYYLEYLPKPFCEMCRTFRQLHFKETTVDMVKYHSLDRCLKYNRYLVRGWESKVTNYTFPQPWTTLNKLNSRNKPLRFP